MKLTIALLLILLPCATTAQSRGPVDLANANVPAGAQRITYGTDPLQFAELRVPSTPGPHPVAIVIHGGCWVAKLGDLDERAVAIDYMRPLAAALTDAGIATWSVEYRRLGNAGGGWPGTFQDIAHAADFLRTLADTHQLDLSRVITIGHSAGGHFAMWLAARSTIPTTSELYMRDPLSLIGVVNLDGPSDLDAMSAVERWICRTPVITDLMGGTADEQPARYRAASPIELLPLRVRQEVFAGKMFAKQAAPYDRAALSAGDTVRSTVLDNASHFVFVDPQSEEWPQVIAAVRRLLAKPD